MLLGLGVSINVFIVLTVICCNLVGIYFKYE